MSADARFRWTTIAHAGRALAAAISMAMRFSILGSGSSGNSALLVTEGARVLVDAGFSARKLGQFSAGSQCRA